MPHGRLDTLERRAVLGDGQCCLAGVDSGGEQPEHRHNGQEAGVYAAHA